MKITTITLTDKGLDDNDYQDAYKICVDDEPVASFFDGDHKDNSLGRGFSDVYAIPELMEMAYLAGKNGEPFEIVKAEVDEM